ncbi:MAG: hypothetical protein A2527_09410 [Candidatus Lambdaproteobacteria bacterium RIFOXYD2_FULL_50_16]|uniref:Pseudouridine synthase RsuA/RluA-like domain-containing protein n=1 Tax=Candidatus Lambdaproteobacteria bacterium RIFOXYD2_FULL_50_16 TaxID=1817772 RepID=A0A1F6G7I6_9PROT|nr:MAG: hypothetical protein A2527_09410 [Candidatus Lambdaproteobacteria bacterium RIFOXYD2_FULL_50_16]
MGERLERVLAGRILINGKAPTEWLQTGDLLEYLHLREDEADLADTPLVILYEDDDLLAISKPPHLPVSPGGRFYFCCLAILAKERFGLPELSPMHRLDLETSGVLLFGKNKLARTQIQPLFELHQIEKLYEAITFGDPGLEPIEGDMVPLVGSKIHSKQTLIPADEPRSKTKILSVEPFGPYFLIKLAPLTGKTNQLRVHLAHRGAPIVGDKKYYPDEQVYLDWFDHRQLEPLLERLKLHRQALHCQALAFENPLTRKPLQLQDDRILWEETLTQIRDL